MKQKPIIGITMGDPAGIGPEIVIKALAGREIYDKVRPLVIGNVDYLKQTMEILKMSLKINEVEKVEDCKFQCGILDVINIPCEEKRISFGKMSSKTGRASFDYIKKSIEMGLSGFIDGVATAPINKEAIHAAGVDFIGHTEMYADLTSSKDVLTMFQVNNLRIFFLTRHMSLIEACNNITFDNVYKGIGLSHDALVSLGFNKPKLAVAALNPHGGENGLFGYEEVREMTPAIAKANEEGIDVYGPVPADSVFHLAKIGRYDAVLSLYHDQGHIAAKTLDFEKTVSVTVGLPFVRTSVDHGTAFDIAGKGIASSVSMEEAIKVAGEYAFLVKQTKE
ncbi:MAG: 4-hydroxythreonine-4-phosphate dehydrogenase PdxA [Tepidanaerobacteraceae bacterium]|jgi:4-hydroxythreonine-4-phosphate dehydrogenase